MHVHSGAVHALTIFLTVVLVGTFWRISAAHMVASSNPTLAGLGKAMAFQY